MIIVFFYNTSAIIPLPFHFTLYPHLILNLYMRKKQIANSINLTVYNIVIQPETLQSSERYVELLRKIKEEEIAYITYGDKATQLYSLKEWDGLLYGELVNYTVLSTIGWYNSKSKEIEPYTVNPDMHPNPIKWAFFFLPDTHRLAVVSKASVHQIDKFFNYAFSVVTDKDQDESVQFHVVASSSSIKDVFIAPDLTSLEIRVHYSNNDSDDDWDGPIDRSMKESDVRSVVIKLQGTKKNPLKILENTLFGAFLNLSKSNGTFKATKYDEGKRQVISSGPVPEKKTIAYEDEVSLFEKIKAFLTGRNNNG